MSKRAKRIEEAARRAKIVLANMADENPRRWWEFWKSRWAIAAEPLRHDARHVAQALRDALSAPADEPEEPEEPEAWRCYCGAHNSGVVRRCFLCDMTEDESRAALRKVLDAARDDCCICDLCKKTGPIDSDVGGIVCGTCWEKIKEPEGAVEKAREAFCAKAWDYFAAHSVAMTTGINDPYPQDAAMRTHRAAFDAYIAAERAARGEGE